MQQQMPAKPFLIYRSSAGSGKTRSLSKEYLKLALSFRSDYFKHILAVTFTNKATQEMKDRILKYLFDFSKGIPNELAEELKTELGLDARTFQDQSEQTLSLILHNYGQFSISTIDAFFQRIIRSFTREAGLMGNFRLEVDHELILEEVVQRLFDDLGKDKDLTDWVIKFATDQMMDGKNWNFSRSLVNFAKEVLKEDFKLIEDEVIHRDNPDAIKKIQEALMEDLEAFKAHLKKPAIEAVQILMKNGITVYDISNGNSGTAWKFFHEWAAGNEFEPGARVRGAAESEENWATKKHTNRLKTMSFAKAQLMPILNRMLGYYDANAIRITSVKLVLQNFYKFGLISDIISKLTDYKLENNVMLIADASKFLNKIIGDSDTPFIYEKAGSFYNHFLIDEFQDTSGLQWENFKPLLQDGLDQELNSMVVGDVKQSVYRWRGSDLTLLQEKVIQQIGEQRTDIKELRTNYRSAGNIIDFNNELFFQAAHRLTELTGTPYSNEVYHDVAQNGVKFPGEGFVHCEFFENWVDEGKETALSKLPQWVEAIQEKGIKAGDIAILVRENKDGQTIANHFLKYKESENKRPNCSYDLVSNESLRLDTASSVSLLVTAFKYINNPNDMVALGEFTIARSILKEKLIEAEVLLNKSYRSENPLSPNVVLSLSSLPIEEVTESLIRLLELGKDFTELAYLQAFQDVVLEFSAYEKNDIASFLDWWELNRTKKSIQSSNQDNAINIITIHKAKGLQFKYVIVPFCDWKLSHEGMKSPVLWCKTDKEPFDKIGYMAIQYKEDMAKSFFAEEYETEKKKVFLDNLNMLYVAFTRAENGLIVMGQKFTEGKNPTYSGQLISESIRNNQQLKKYFDAGTGIFEMGSIKPNAEKIKYSGREAITLQHYSTVDWRRKLVIRTQGSEFFEKNKSEKRVKINYGILLHQVLSRIEYKTEVDDIIHQFHVEGIIMDEEKEKLTEVLSTMMNHPQIGNWFTKEWTVKTEAPVLVPNGKPGRIDRVVFKQTPSGKKKAVIIDYKTGDKKQDDREQVENYSLILSQMGYVDVEAFLVYLFPLEVVSVVSRMNLSLF
jgi:ATP-dependent helicase/nuclease subunit A